MPTQGRGHGTPRTFVQDRVDLKLNYTYMPEDRETAAARRKDFDAFRCVRQYSMMRQGNQVLALCLSTLLMVIASPSSHGCQEEAKSTLRGLSLSVCNLAATEKGISLDLMLEQTKDARWALGGLIFFTVSYYDADGRPVASERIVVVNPSRLARKVVFPGIQLERKSHAVAFRVTLGATELRSRMIMIPSNSAQGQSLPLQGP